jgi:hypothetical protein
MSERGPEQARAPGASEGRDDGVPAGLDKEPAAGFDAVPEANIGTRASDAGGIHVEERPPLGTWRRMYALVLLTLALLIVLFYLFTRYFQ